MSSALLYFILRSLAPLPFGHVPRQTTRRTLLTCFIGSFRYEGETLFLPVLSPVLPAVGCQGSPRQEVPCRCLIVRFCQQ